MEKDAIKIIDQYLLEYLRYKVSQEGMSQSKLARETGVRQGTINGYLNTSDKRSRPIGGASLDNILRLFPELQGPILSALERRGGIHQVANGNILSTITQTAGGGDAGDAEALRDRVIRSIIDLELPADVQSQILKVVKNTK